ARVAPGASYPLSSVGQLRNGCTGFLAGPCHVIAVAHCVYDPKTDTWWPGLEFSAGRNGPDEWAPHGTVTWRGVDVPEQWRRGRSSGAAGSEPYDYALLVLSAPLGRRLGWLQVGVCCSPASRAGNTTRHQQQQQQQQSGRLPPCGGIWVRVGGYPDNQQNGTMWDERCRLYGSSVGGRGSRGADGGGEGGGLSWHDCHTRGGNSGSPLWMEPGWTAEAPAENSSADASSPREQRQEQQPVACALAMHVAAESTRRWDASGACTAAARGGWL
ncbi:Glutamyl endopeptidase, partial [Tetrabaena socialis]